MKKILISSAVAVAAAFALNAGAVHAATEPPAPPVGDAYVASQPPVTPTTVGPVLTVPTVAQSPLPVTGSDSNTTLAAGAIVLGVGGAMVLVGRTRRRTAPTS
jgi:LPXTG-motif cell wall-anchored protein